MIDNILMYGGIAGIFGIIKAHFKGQLRQWKQWTVSVGVSIAVAVITGFAVESFHFEQGIVFACVAASAILAENIVVAMLGLGDALQRDPVGVINRLRRK